MENLLIVMALEMKKLPADIATPLEIQAYTFGLNILESVSGYISSLLYNSQEKMGGFVLQSKRKKLIQLKKIEFYSAAEKHVQDQFQNISSHTKFFRFIGLGFDKRQHSGGISRHPRRRRMY